MNQNWMVGLLVLAAAVYSVWYVLPTSVRPSLGRRLDKWLARTGDCSSCKDCKGCANRVQQGGAGAVPGVQALRFYSKTRD